MNAVSRDTCGGGVSLYHATRAEGECRCIRRHVQREECRCITRHVRRGSVAVSRDTCGEESVAVSRDTCGGGVPLYHATSAEERVSKIIALLYLNDWADCAHI